MRPGIITKGTGRSFIFFDKDLIIGPGSLSIEEASTRNLILLSSLRNLIISSTYHPS